MYKGNFKPRPQGGKPPFGSRKPFSRPAGGKRFSHAAPRQAYLDISKFINKAVITEEVERFVPEHKFADFLLDERLKANIVKKGYTDPTPIQDRSIPHVLRGEDVVGIANTGTGKTAAFSYPAYQQSAC